MREVQSRIDAVAEQVHRESDDIDISGPLPVAEQRSLDPVGPGQDAELRIAYAAATVVVRVYA